MKQIMLRVATVLAEVFRGELPQASRGYFSFSSKVQLPQHPLDPDIDWECAQSIEAEEQCAIRHFLADARQAAELCARFGVGQASNCIEVYFAPGNHPRCTEEILRAESEAAFAQLSLGQSGESFRGWIGEKRLALPCHEGSV